MVARFSSRLSWLYILLDEDLQRTLADRFTNAVMHRAQLPAKRRADVEDAPRFSATETEITCTCGITGSTYAADWDGSAASAEDFAQTVGEETAWLVANTRHYAWLRASR